MSIDWTKPIEAVHKDGRIVSVALDTDGWNGSNPDRDGDYWIEGDGFDGCQCRNPSGKLQDDGWTIRNVVAVPNASEADELTTLRAFREQAIARYPDLAKPETDEEASERFVDEFWEANKSEEVGVIQRAFAWARANPR